MIACCFSGAEECQGSVQLVCKLLRKAMAQRCPDGAAEMDDYKQMEVPLIVYNLIHSTGRVALMRPCSLICCYSKLPGNTI